MKNRSDGAGDAAAIAVILILLLLAGGVGIYYAFARQQAAALQVERARLAEAQAVTRAKNDLDAGVAEASRTISQREDSSTIQDGAIRGAIESVLREQETAWNRGDLDAFMSHYSNSDALTFSSGGKTTRGWTATLTRYRERYATPEGMGRLQLSDLEITPLGESAALVLGKWSVERENEPLSGNFSLVVRKFDDRWLIIHDHTSRTTE